MPPGAAGPDHALLGGIEVREPVVGAPQNGYQGGRLLKYLIKSFALRRGLLSVDQGLSLGRFGLPAGQYLLGYVDGEAEHGVGRLRTVAQGQVGQVQVHFPPVPGARVVGVGGYFAGLVGLAGAQHPAQQGQEALLLRFRE